MSFVKMSCHIPSVKVHASCHGLQHDLIQTEATMVRSLRTAWLFWKWHDATRSVFAIHRRRPPLHLRSLQCWCLISVKASVCVPSTSRRSCALHWKQRCVWVCVVSLTRWAIVNSVLRRAGLFVLSTVEVRGHVAQEDQVVGPHRKWVVLLRCTQCQGSLTRCLPSANLCLVDSASIAYKSSPIGDVIFYVVGSDEEVGGQGTRGVLCCGILRSCVLLSFQNELILAHVLEGMVKAISALLKYGGVGVAMRDATTRD